MSDQPVECQNYVTIRKQPPLEQMVLRCQRLDAHRFHRAQFTDPDSKIVTIRWDVTT